MNNNYADAIFWITSLMIIEEEEHFGGSGTGFVISYLNKIYFITANHCVKDVTDNLYITNFIHRNPLNIPFSKVIKSKNELDEYNDICILEVSFSEILKSVENEKNEYLKNSEKELENSKEYKKIMRTNYSPTRKLKLLKETTIYQKQTNGTLNFIKNLDNSLVHIKNLDFEINPIFNLGDPLYVLGYPNEKQNINYDINHITENLCGINCIYSGVWETSSEIHSATIIDIKENDLNGYSGSPVFMNKKIVGLLVRGGNNKIHFIDMNFIIKHLQQNN